jgi:hypothetical protein
VLPGPNDIAIANNFTVTIDQNIAVQTLSNSTFGTSTAGGFFQITTVGVGVTRNATMSLGLGNSAGTYIGATGGLLRISATSGTVDLGSTNIRGGFTLNHITLLVSGAGVTVRTTGSCLGGGNSGTLGVSVTGNSAILYLGDVGSNGVGFGLGITGTSVTAYVQNVNNPPNNQGSAGGITWGGGSGVLYTKNIFGSSSVFSGTNSAGVFIAANGCAVYVDGQATAGTVSPAFYTTAIGTYHFKGPLIHSWNSVAPVCAPNWKFLPATSDTYYQVYDSSQGSYTLSASAVGPYPEEGDVRDAVSYGGTLSGELDIPASSEVSYGALVGNTTGTASLTQSDVASAEVALGVTLSSKLLNSATVGTTGEQIIALGGA